MTLSENDDETILSHISPSVGSVSTSYSGDLTIGQFIVVRFEAGRGTSTM
jgi:hypothetical protein